MERPMARILDNEGKLLGGLELSIAELLAPLNNAELAPIQAPNDTPSPPIYGSEEEVLRLVCSFGKLPLFIYAASEMVEDSDSRRTNCQNQVDKPYKRYYCPDCGGYYCVTHAAISAHDCQSVFRH